MKATFRSIYPPSQPMGTLTLVDGVAVPDALWLAWWHDHVCFRLAPEGGVDESNPCVRRDEGEAYIRMLAHQFNAGYLRRGHDRGGTRAQPVSRRYDAGISSDSQLEA